MLFNVPNYSVSQTILLSINQLHFAIGCTYAMADGAFLCRPGTGLAYSDISMVDDCRHVLQFTVYVHIKELENDRVANTIFFLH